jgi:hypothetical protein
MTLRLRSTHHLLFGLLLFFGPLLLCSGTVRAIPAADYHKNLREAITALDTFEQADEEESLSDYQKSVSETLAAVRNALPKTLTVQCGEIICTVDNSWLYQQLEEVEKSAEPERPQIVARILERLQAIEERVSELEKPTPESARNGGANERLAAILRRSEYEQQVKGASALDRLWRDIWQWLMNLLPKSAPLKPGRAGLFSMLAQVFVVLFALAAIAYVLKTFVPHILGSRKQKAKAKTQPRIVLGEFLGPEESAVDLLSEAEVLARRGELRAAIRKAYIALLVELGDRKILSLAQHKTNRDYLRSVTGVPSLYSKMSDLTDSFERHWYGFATATQDDWQNFRTAYKSALQQ